MVVLSRSLSRVGVLALACVVAGCQGAGTETRGLDRKVQNGVPPAALALAANNSETCRPVPRQRIGGLAGRTITVRSAADIALGPREVVLTFDDGPRPKRTKAVLRALDQRGVKATFFLVGEMAAAFPAEVREIAAQGHTVGHHTYGHPNLTKLSTKAALAEIAKGERAIARALQGSGESLAPFFRFPYLADTRALHRALASRGTIAIGADIDSKDYFRSTPDAVLARTMRRLNRRGRGILLFHDIHPRTVSMLPALLSRLDAEGYRVVHLTPSGRSVSCVRFAS